MIFGDLKTPPEISESTDNSINYILLPGMLVETWDTYTQTISNVW